MALWLRFTSRISGRRHAGIDGLRLEMGTSPSRHEPLRIVLPTSLAPEARGWHLGIQSLCDTISACKRPTDIKIFHIDGASRATASSDIVLFSFSNPIDYRVLFDFCHAVGLPPRASDRGDSDPIVIGGGIGLANPEPLATYLDVIILGLDHEPI